jgi:hypothetical protein
MTQLLRTLQIPPGKGNGQGKLKLFQLVITFAETPLGSGGASRAGDGSTMATSDRSAPLGGAIGAVRCARGA